MASATVTLTNAQAGDALAINGTLPVGISATINTGTPGVITVTLSGSASKASYDTALHQIVFSSTANPDTTDRTITVVVNDGLANSNIATSTIHVVDATVPTGGTPDLLAASDSGTSQIDNITNVTNPTFSVTLNSTVAVGDTVELLLAGASLAHPVTHVITAADIAAHSVNLTVTPGDLGADGNKWISAKFTDPAGNTSTTSALKVIVDNTDPTAGTLAFANLTDSGSSDSTPITQDGTLRPQPERQRRCQRHQRRL